MSPQCLNRRQQRKLSFPFPSPLSPLPPVICLSAGSSVCLLYASFRVFGGLSIRSPPRPINVQGFIAIGSASRRSVSAAARIETRQLTAGGEEWTPRSTSRQGLLEEVPNVIAAAVYG
jgi:hypothetical protein